MINIPKFTQATLPAHLDRENDSIAAMDIGASGWTVPWAMYTDNQRRLWLDGDYTLCASPGGTVAMHIYRDENGWHVNASQCESRERWGARDGLTKSPIAVASFTR